MTVSYTHLDVYKRQVNIEELFIIMVKNNQDYVREQIGVRTQHNTLPNVLLNEVGVRTSQILNLRKE